MYKYTIPKFVEFVRHQTEKAYSDAQTGKRRTNHVRGLSANAMLAYTSEFELMRCRIMELEAIITLIDDFAASADNTCDEPGIPLSEAARRTLKDRGYPSFQGYRPPITLLCQAGRDGDCFWLKCPQLRDGEPARTGRHCPFDKPLTEETP